jgi:hypothetical protein
METETPTDSELREAFGEATIALMYLAAKHWLKGNEEGKLLALNGALCAFMKKHQAEALWPEDWERLAVFPMVPDVEMGMRVIEYPPIEYPLDFTNG